MVAYRYIKKIPRQKKLGTSSLILSSVFLVCGFFLLALVAWPILSFEILLVPNLQASIVSPLADTQVLGTKIATTDLTQASNWFPTAAKVSPSKITSYMLSIPKLKIKDAAVIIGSEDLSKSLIQWGSTANPGEFGNAVIFGHSVLPVFFDPKNYMTIFSTLPTLKEKDEVFVYFDGITYKYEVFEMKVFDPSDLSPLEQKYDDSYITLITCVPPGTYWKRLAVKARLVKI